MPRYFSNLKATFRLLPFLVVVLLLAIAFLNWSREAFGSGIQWVSEVLDVSASFAAVFLGIFIEAAPYLLMGTLASGLIEEFFKAEDLTRLLPRNRLAAVATGSLLGMFFPVCECGTIPLARRLMRKGMPVSVGVAFLLAAPVINPIVIASTLAAFGFGTIFWARIAMTLGVAVFTGLVFSLAPDAQAVLRSPRLAPSPVSVDAHPPVLTTNANVIPVKRRLKNVLLVAGDEFFEMGRFLVIGALLAALMQTLIPQGWLLSIGQGPILSVVILTLLGVLLSICSTVDSFIALAFTGTFSSGAVLAFLVYGPMVDIKAIIMYLRVFKRRTVIYLTLLPLLLTLVSAVLINLWMG